MTSQPTPRPPLPPAVLEDLLETSLLARVVLAKPKRRKELRAIYEELLDTPTADPETRAMTKAYIASVFEIAAEVADRIRSKGRGVRHPSREP